MKRRRNVTGTLGVVVVLTVVGLGAVLASGWGWLAAVEGAGDPRPLVVTSTTILADLARQVGGDRVRVYSLLAPGQDPHSYEPVPRDGLALSRADLVLLNGYGLDAWAERLLGFRLPAGSPGPAAAGAARAGAAPAGAAPPAAGRGAATSAAASQPGATSPATVGPALAAPRGVASGRPPVVRVAEEIPAQPLPWPADPHRPDPHLWMDPTLVALYVARIRDALAAIDPAGAGEYRRRADGLQVRLRELDAWIARQVATVPPGRRLLITTHDAYRYFGRRYGVRVVETVWGISTEEEPSAADLARLFDGLRRYEVPAFVETTINPKLMEELAAQAGVRIGGQLYADALGPPGSGAETYTGMMRHNVETIVAALRGQASHRPPVPPEWERQGFASIQERTGTRHTRRGPAG